MLSFANNNSNNILVRGHVVEDRFKHLGRLSSVHIKGKIFVNFVNEMGKKKDLKLIKSS